MSTLYILTSEEQQAFDYPPRLSTETKAIYFVITEEVKAKLNKLRKPTNKIGFLLQYGFFKACQKFFIMNRYRQEDIEYVANLLHLSLSDINLLGFVKTGS